MTGGLIYKLTNFLMPVEEAEEHKTELPRPNLTVHSSTATELKLLIAIPHSFDDVRDFANHLKAKEAIIVNFEHVDQDTRQRIGDFLNGVCYTLAGAVQKLTETSMIYVPENVDISKELYAYAIPTYIKQ